MSSSDNPFAPQSGSGYGSANISFGGAEKAPSGVSFGNADDMLAFLGVVPGSVTLFGIIYDKDNNVTVFIDEGLLAYDRINAHPLTNEATTNLATADMLRFLESHGHKPEILPRITNGDMA